MRTLTTVARGSRAVTIALLLTTATALTTAACGSGDDNGSGTDASSSRQVLVGAATKAAANSYRFQMSLDVEGATTGTEAPADVKITGDGTFDSDDHRGTMTMTIPAGAKKATLQTVVIGTTVYEKLPIELAANAPGGATKPWIKIDLTKVGEIGGVNLGTIASAQAADPSQAVAYLRGASTDVKVVGKEQLRGDDVTHYQFTIDLAKAVKNAPEPQRAAMKQAADLYGGGDPLPTDAWIDGEGRLRKMSYAVTRANLTVPTDQSAADATFKRILTTFELFDFGTEVVAEAPPAAQVTDVSELFRGKSEAITNSGSAVSG